MSERGIGTGETGAVQGATDADGTSRRSRRRRFTWAKLVLVAALASAVGAFVTANWHERHFSFIAFSADINAGAIILGCVAAGFVIGIAFVWSALSGD